MKFGIFSLLDFYDDGKQSLTDLYRQTLEAIEYADQLGFDAFWLGEHHFYLNKNTTMAGPNPAVLLAAAAQRTSRIGLNTAVANLALRHPFQLAEDYALVDLLSGGRLGFGIGRGAFGHEYKALGQNQADSAGRFEEAWEIIRQAWQGEAVNYKGRFYQVENVRLNVLPVQKPLPRYWLATMSPTSFAARGQAGQPVIAFPYLSADGLEDMGKLAGHYRNNFELRGHSLENYELPMIFHAAVAPTRVEADQNGSEALERYISHQHSPTQAHAVVRHLHDRQQLFFDSPVGIIKTIEKYQAATSSNHFIFWLDFGRMDEKLVRQSMELLAREVIPYFNKP